MRLHQELHQFVETRTSDQEELRQELVRRRDGQRARLGGAAAAKRRKHKRRHRPRAAGEAAVAAGRASAHGPCDLRIPLTRHDEDVAREALEKVGDAQRGKGAARVREEQDTRLGEVV